MGAGAGDIKVAQTEANAATEAAEISGSYDYKIAQEQSQAVIQQAELDSEARITEAEYNYKAVQAQCEADLEIAKMEYEVKMEEAKNDAMRITQVEYTNALANLTSAEAEQDEAAAKATKYELQYGGDSSGSNGDYYYYG
jgi:hypothetical protein